MMYVRWAQSGARASVSSVTSLRCRVTCVWCRDSCMWAARGVELSFTVVSFFSYLDVSCNTKLSAQDMLGVAEHTYS